MPATIRLATVSDAARMLDIYAPSVRDNAVSFELALPSEQEFQERVRHTLERTPWLVCDVDGRVEGYAYAGPHRIREAYRWSVDAAVYVHAGSHRRAVGRALCTALLACLRVQGYYNAYAGITLPNSASVGLHERVGFEPVGVHRNAGYKLGTWHDVGWWHLALRPHDPAPTEPLALSAVMGTPEWRAAIDQGQRIAVQSS